MRGNITRRGDRSWRLKFESGERNNGTGKRQTKFVTVRGTRRDAERELTRILNAIETGAFVEPSKMTVEKYLETWLDHAKQRVSAKTFSRYEEIVKKTSFGWTRIALPHEAYASCHPGLLFQGACQRPAQWTWWSFGADGEASSSDFERSAAPGRAMAASPFQSVRSRRAAAASTARNAHHRSEANRAAAQGRRAEEDLHAGASRRDHRHAPRRIARVALEKR